MTTNNQVDIQAVHHLCLTVTDVARSNEFYSSIFGFEVAGEFGPRVVLIKGNTLLALGPSPDPTRSIPGDKFDENRVGLDHLSFAVSNRGELEHAMRVLDEKKIDHGDIVALAPFGIQVLMFRDPDNIQVELSAPLG
jgi:catechol 2,3-dioxygenase-like lactoylglutathione lyase family enzyme